MYTAIAIILMAIITLIVCMKNASHYRVLFDTKLLELKGANSQLMRELSSKHEEVAMLHRTLVSQEDSITERVDAKNLVWVQENEKRIREDAIKRSKEVNKGQGFEKLAPFLMDGIIPKDCCFLGQPVDYIIFEGMTDISAGISDEIKQVTFVDVKTGKSSLSKVQRRIRDAIQSNRVSFAVFNPEEKNDTAKAS